MRPSAPALHRRLGWIGACTLGLAACASAPTAPTAPQAGFHWLNSPMPTAPVAASSAPAAATVPVPPVAAPPASRAASALPGTPPPVESPAVAARFPDPAVAYRTPAFEPGHDGFTSNAELRRVLRGLLRNGGDDAGASTVRLIELGSSQSGAPLEALHFSHAPLGVATPRAPRATVLLTGQQHGDEPAGAEALLVIAQQLADGGPLAPLLDRIDIVMLPRANPDGAAGGRRATASGIDMNRDHLLLRTPEAQAQAQLVAMFAPVVVVDAHEYAVFGNALQKFGALPRNDALIQYATVANLSPFLTRASEEWFRQPLLQRLKQEGLASDWYHTSPDDPADRKMAMGGVQPDIGRNADGLRNAVSFLVETRGADLGRAHLQRRVHTQVTAIASLLRSAAARADDLLKLRRFLDQELAAMACQGEVVVEADETPSEYTLTMLDPLTGADKPVTVTWDSALALTVRKRRVRPCGYWLGADQLDAVLRLRGLGVLVHKLEEAGELRGEVYRDTGREPVAVADTRRDVADAGGMRRLAVTVAPALMDVDAGSYYVGLDQPLANLVIAAIEPDTPMSFVTHRIVDGIAAQARVMQRPGVRMSVVP